MLAGVPYTLHRAEWPFGWPNIAAEFDNIQGQLTDQRTGHGSSPATVAAELYGRNPCQFGEFLLARTATHWRTPTDMHYIAGNQAIVAGL